MTAAVAAVALGLAASVPTPQAVIDRAFEVTFRPEYMLQNTFTDVYRMRGRRYRFTIVSWSPNGQRFLLYEERGIVRRGRVVPRRHATAYRG